MTTLWKLSQDGNSASRTLDNGGYESRMVSAIPADELTTALPANLPNPNDVIDAQIVALEQANPITHRALREFMLGTLAAVKLDPSANHATALVAQVEAQADALRMQRK